MFFLFVSSDNNAFFSGEKEAKNYLAIIDEYAKQVERIELQNPDSALQFAIKMLLLAEENSDTFLLSTIYAKIGKLYFTKNNHLSAIEFYLKSLPYSIKSNDLYTHAFIIVDIGNSYYAEDLFDDALSYYENAYKLFQESKSDYGMAVALNNIALCKIKSKDLNAAEKLFLQGLELREKIGDSVLIAHSLAYLADVYRYKKDYKKSEEYILKAIYITSKFVSDNNTSNEIPVETIRKAGLLYNEMKKYEEAINYFQQAIKRNATILKFQALDARISLDMAYSYKGLNDKKNAVAQALRAINIASKYKERKILKEAFSFLVDHYRQEGDKDNTIKYLNYLLNVEREEKERGVEKRLIDLSNFIFNYENEAKIRLKELELAKAEEMKNMEQRQKYIFLVLSILFVTMLLAIVLKNKKLKSLNLSLQEKNELISKQKEKNELMLEELKQLHLDRDKFYSIFIHDLKSPLHALVSYSEILHKEAETIDDNDRKLFTTHVYNITQTINELVKDMLEWLGIQLGKKEIVFENINIRNIADEIISLLNFTANQKNIIIINRIPNELIVNADRNSIKSIFQNILTNSIKFSNSNSEINIYGEEISSIGSPGKIKISVEDRGSGMNENQIENFNNNIPVASQRGTNGEVGTGFGLLIIKELIKLNNGQCEIKSKINKGTTFSFTLNKGN